MEIEFKPTQRRGVAILILLVIIATLIVKLNRQGAEMERILMIDRELEVRQDSIPSESILTEGFQFDPNIVELSELLEIGLTKYEALSILRYRAAGKIFRIKEELIGCWGISDSLYFALEPYIVIGEEFQYKSQSTQTELIAPKEISTQKSREWPTPHPFMLDTVTAEYVSAHGLLSLRQAEVMLRWHATSHISDIEELRECYVVSDSAALLLAQYIIFTPEPVKDEAKIAIQNESIALPINLNKADSATLRSVNGIGEKSVVAILKRRKELGGFHSVEQLQELNVILKGNYEKIITQIFVDSCDISKIDVNFASATELSTHPYFSNKQVRRVLHLRQLKGGWSNIESMIEDKIFTSEEAQKVRPYLNFVLPDKSFIN